MPRGPFVPLLQLPVGPSPNGLPQSPLKTEGNLKVGLLEDAGQLRGRAALLRQLRQVPQDLLHQLQVVVPNSLQLRLLQPLMGLVVGALQVRPDASPRTLGYQTEPWVPPTLRQPPPPNPYLRALHKR